MTEKISLSVVVAAKNSAGCIADCLKSVDWAGEIIVFDDLSSDNTAEIAKQFTDKIVRRSPDITGKSSIVTYDAAAFDWILSLDPDERVTPELRDEIIALLKSGPTCNGYMIPRKIFMGSVWVRYGGLYPSLRLKLFKKNTVNSGEPTEIEAQAHMKNVWGTLQNDILCFAYRDFTEAITKLDRETDLEAKRWFHEKKRISILGALIKTLINFWSAYFLKRGRKDGVIGLFLSVNAGMYYFLSFAKYWELKKEKTGKDKV